MGRPCRPGEGGDRSSGPPRQADACRTRTCSWDRPARARRRRRARSRARSSATTRAAAACPTCYRITRGLHPDVHIISPEGAATYLVPQVREIIHDTNLAPIEGREKVYIVEDADAFNDASANAFLKTLEEPPDDVVIVLLAHSLDAVLPTDRLALPDRALPQTPARARGASALRADRRRAGRGARAHSRPPAACSGGRATSSSRRLAETRARRSCAR